MGWPVSDLKTLVQAGFDDLVDVRSPSEFAEDHIPGAINLPVLSDAERAQVGTVYVREDRFKAKRMGAALVARNAADHIEQRLSDRDGSWRPLVYCWRGGQRSGSFTSILTQIGWRAEVLEGGYQTYRRMVVRQVYDAVLPHRIVLLDGNTGTAKTDLLALLRQAGEQVIDLEGLARHRGSLLGGMDSGQPSQKMFEGQIAVALAQADPTRVLFLEAESNKIGRRIIPPSLWKAMLAAPRITVAASLHARTDYLMRSYADLVVDREALKTRIGWLRHFHAAEKIEAWLAAIDLGDLAPVVRDLMQDHYDPRYAKTQARGQHQDLGSVPLPDLTPETLANQALPALLRLAEATPPRA
jgi:tRNA 2-selenouridine synthase